MAHSSNQEFKRFRATQGASASRMSPTRFAPYRKITGEENDGVRVEEVLECGHRLRPRHDMIGTTYPERRRCVDCLRISCAKAGHPLIDWFGPNKFGSRSLMRCKCTAVEPRDWFAALGKPLSVDGRVAALALVAEAGLNVGEGALVLGIVAREIEHDEPASAQRYLRNWLPPSGSEAFLFRILATMCAGSL